MKNKTVAFNYRQLKYHDFFILLLISDNTKELELLIVRACIGMHFFFFFLIILQFHNSQASGTLITRHAAAFGMTSGTMTRVISPWNILVGVAEMPHMQYFQE